MKKLLSLLLFAGILAACGDEKTPIGDKITGLDASEVKLAFDDTSETQKISFTAREAWTVTVTDKTRSSTWASVSPMNGGAGNVELTLGTTEPNTGAEPRSADVTINSGGVSKTFTMTQHSEASQEEADRGGRDPEKYVQAGDASHTYTCEAQTPVLEVAGNFGFIVTISYGQGGDGWLSAKVSKGEKGDLYTVSLNIMGNTAATARTATLKFTDSAGAVYARTTITQNGIGGTGGDPEKYARGWESTYTYDSSAQTKVIDVNSNFKFSVNITYGEGSGWLSTKVSEGGKKEYYTLSLNIRENTTASMRTARLDFVDDKGAGYGHTVIVQSAGEGTGGDPTKYVQVNYFDRSSAAAQTVTMSVASNFQFKIGTDVISGGKEWFEIHTTPPPSGSDVYTITVDITANDTSDYRIVELLFTDDKGNIYNRVKIEQAPGKEAEEPFYITFLEATPEDLPLNGGTMDVRFSVSDANATVTCSQLPNSQWVTVGTPTRETQTGNTYKVGIQCGSTTGLRKGSFLIRATLNGITTDLQVSVSQVP